MSLMECSNCKWVGPDELAVWVIRNENGEAADFDARCPKCFSGDIKGVKEGIKKNDTKETSLGGGCEREL